MTPGPKRLWFRFSLRTLFVAVAASALLSWMVYQLNWIRARQAMLKEPDVWQTNAGYYREFDMPWSLRLFGEGPIDALDIPESKHERAHRLFPEAILKLRRGE